ncbi:CaiB/BaiF CoA-transferase family protein [Paracoccus sp. DMF-8]|nr:CaiB/BaiF CoA-transferase family protein [Paracoccus sp. DMF-8]MDF3606879.1 CaiB/BaiF CoA-transferase family protein [Paracoccus sp. DMF-8]
MKPLAGLKVVELARILAGPWAGQTLADLGAEVIKVEAPEGDDTRRWRPPFITRDGDESAAYFHATNRGKASVTADFRTAEGQAKVRDLIRDADVVLENFKLGGLAKYGLDHASLAQVNPRLVYCSITGFGQTGPYAARAGYDYIIQGMSGLMSVTGAPDGQPQKVGVPVARYFHGHLCRRRHSGGAASATDHGPGPTYRYGAVRCRDGGDGQSGDELSGDGDGTAAAWQCPSPIWCPMRSLTAPMPGSSSRPEMTGNIAGLCAGSGPARAGRCARCPRPTPNAHRQPREPTAALSSVTKLWKRDELLAACESQSVPAGPINDMADVFADPQIIARGLQIAPEGIPGVRTPIVFSDSELSLDRASPRLGQDD